MKYLLLLLPIVFIAAKCNRNDGCEPDAVRCHDNQVQICNAGQNWDVIADCDDFEKDGEPVPMKCEGDDPECVEVQ